MEYAFRPRSNTLERKEAQTKAKDLVSLSRKCINFLGCIAGGILYFYLLLYSNHLWTIDTCYTIFLAEYCGWGNERRRKKIAVEDCSSPISLSEKGLLSEKTPYFEAEAPNPRLDCIAAVVGYREDPVIFTRALASYNDAENCKFVLVSVDGDAKEDQEMVNVFQRVYPTRSATIHLELPIVEAALQMDKEKPKWMADEEVIRKCCLIARKALDDNNIKLHGPDAINRLCVSHPHMHKKGVMFTSFIFCLVLADSLGTEFLWTSDSDSIVFPKTLSRTMGPVAGDPMVAGASTSLSIHNKHETIITKLGNCVFLNELHLSRCFSSALGANDCQSGPCAVFRISAIPAELLAWYQQTVMGHWMVINEDRHLTTRLLLRGWKVLFIPDVFTATESPVNLRRWLLQQVRWARSVHIETVCRPEIYVIQPPIFFFAALRREIAAFAVLIIVLVYFFTGVVTLRFSFRDYAWRTMFTLVYLAVRNPLRPSFTEWLWSIPANLFYNVPLPAVQFWSLITVLNDGWGTTMRSQTELSKHSKLKSKIWEVGFFVLWIGIIGGVMGRVIGTALMLGPMELMLCMATAMTTTWVGFGYWMVVCD